MNRPEKVTVEQVGKLSPEVAARAAEYGARLFHAFCSLYSNEKVKKVKELSVRAGYSSTYLHKILNGSRKITLDVLLQVIAAANDPLERLLRRLARPCPGIEGLDEPLLLALGNPVALLEEWREKPEDRDPFLADVAEWVEDLRAREKERWPVALPLRQVVLSLEEERLRDWRWTKKQLELRGLEHWAELRAKGRLALGSIGELAVVLAAWAATQRVAGLRGNATDALGFAFELADTAADSWAKAFCLQKAAYLGHDLGHDLEALAFVQRATLLLAEDCSLDDLARNTIDRGYFCYYLGRLAEAERLFKTGLARLALTSSSFKQAATLGLAAIATDTGNLPEAERLTAESAKYIHESSLELGHLRWRQGRISAAAKSFSAAIEQYKEAIAVFGRKGQSGDVALVVFDLAQILVSCGRLTELKELGQDVAAWIGPLLSNPIVGEKLEDFLALLKLGNLEPIQIETARQAFREAGIVGRDY